jgi:hypothetical protein
VGGGGGAAGCRYREALRAELRAARDALAALLQPPPPQP